MWEESWGRLDCREEGSGAGEVVDVGAVFITDEVAAIGGEHEAFGVEADAVSTGAGLAKAVACVRGCGEKWEGGDYKAALGVGVEAGGWVAKGIGQESGADVGQYEVGW